jgi:hypothetical protein
MEFDSVDYWKKRYASGGNSGSGSYGRLAEFKAESLNSFIMENEIASIVEYGSGDGNQLGFMEIEKYLGLDVSPDAIAKTSEMYRDDLTKTFRVYEPDTFQVTKSETGDLSISMDVILHLTEDSRYESYMANLFESATRFVGIFNTATDIQLPNMAKHNRFRDHRQWVSKEASSFTEILSDVLPDSYGYPGETGFYYYAKN